MALLNYNDTNCNEYQFTFIKKVGTYFGFNVVKIMTYIEYLLESMIVTDLGKLPDKVGDG